MKFEQLKLDASILKALREKNYEEPTPIQAKAIPLIIQKKDVLATAQTGTGKTAAFAIPIIQNLLDNSANKQSKRTIKALIVTPTRELAIQIDENIRLYAKHTSLRHCVIFGGVKQGKQVQAIRQGIDILVATPGRLLDLIGQKIVHLHQVNTFVLDEADRMLDMGFINDIRKLLKLLPKHRQSLLFSATMPDHIVKLSSQFMQTPAKVSVAPVSSAADTVQQKIYYTNKVDKKQLLLHVLADATIDQALVFSRTKHGADKLVRILQKKQIKAAAIHGNKSQNQRQKALKNFKEKSLRILVATDIAARGIDIQQLGYVINFDIPNIPETYVHRIGRVGRAGATGIALSLCEPEENAFVKDIQKLINQKLEAIVEHPYPQTDKPMTKFEKKAFEQEKKERKSAYFANKNKRESNPNKKKRFNRNGKNRK
jgi:ATP-dependent RNA helicase RhlE